MTTVVPRAHALEEAEQIPRPGGLDDGHPRVSASHPGPAESRIPRLDPLAHHREHHDPAPWIAQAAPALPLARLAAGAGLVDLHDPLARERARFSASASRTLWSKRQTVSYRRPSTRESWSADTPPLSRENAQAAQNHSTSGTVALCITVPAVTEFCRRQLAHWNTRGLDARCHARVPPHAQRNPPGHRSSARNAAHDRSAGNRVAKATRERGRSAG